MTTAATRRTTFALILGAMLVGAALRVTHLGDVPPALNQDEAVNGYDAYSLLVTGRDHHGHPFPFAGLESFGDWTSPLLTFATIPFVAALGLRIEALRAATAVLGVVGIPVVYALATELSRRRAIGVTAAWYFAVSPWCVYRAHFAIPPSAVPTMVAATLLALVWTLRRRSGRGVVATAVVAAATIAAYPTMKLFVPLLLAAAVVIYWRTIPQLNREALAYGLVVFAAIAGPVLYLSVFDPGGRARYEQVSIFRERVTPVRLAREYASYFSPGVFFRRGNGHPGQTGTPPGSGVELRTLAPFVVIGLAVLLAAAARGERMGLDRRSALLLLAALALYPIPGSLTLPTPPVSNPHLARAVQAIPLLAVIVAIGVVAGGDVVRGAADRWWPQRSGAVVAAAGILAAVLVGRELVTRYRYYYADYPRRDDVLRYFQFGLEQAVDYASGHRGEYDEIWMTDMNQPYIYVLFYERWSPNEVHTVLRPRRAPPDFNDVDALGPYRFGPPPFAASDLTAIATIDDPNGKPRYELREGVVRDHGRVLVIHAP